MSTVNAQQYHNQEELLKRFHELDSVSKGYYLDPNIEFFDAEKIEKTIVLYYQQLDILSSIKGNEVLKFNFYKRQGQLFKELKILNESNTNFYKSIYYFSKLKNADVKKIIGDAFLIYGELADNYLDLNQVDSVYTMHNRSTQFSNEYAERKILKVSALSNMGVYFSETLKQYDSAMYYFGKAQKEITTIKKPELWSFRTKIRENIANVYARLNQLKKAKALYNENFTFFKSKDNSTPFDYYMWTRSGIQVAEMAIKLEEIKVAESMLDSVSELLTLHKFPEQGKNTYKYLQTKKNLYLLKGTYKKAYEYILKSKDLLDSMDRAKKTRIGLWSTSLKNMAIEKMKEDVELEELEQHLIIQRKKVKLLLVVLILVISAVTLGFVSNAYKRRKLLYSQDKQIAEHNAMSLDLQNEVLQKKAKKKKRDLIDFAINISQNKEWIQNFFEQIKKARIQRGRAKIKSLHILEEEINSKIKFDEYIKYFHDIEFYVKLKKQYNNLTKTEIKLCTMIRLGFDNEKIAILQHIDRNSVRQSRYRLKKKLKIDQNLDTFLKNF
ncbi:hypothetical protein QBK95_22405 [Aquimarina sp. 2201CG14-23]|nr:hypothetical protein [Aquimarina sp. 2201CG14-23]